MGRMIAILCLVLTQPLFAQDLRDLAGEEMPPAHALLESQSRPNTARVPPTSRRWVQVCFATFALAAVATGTYGTVQWMQQPALPAECASNPNNIAMATGGAGMLVPSVMAFIWACFL